MAVKTYLGARSLYSSDIKLMVTIATGERICVTIGFKVVMADASWWTYSKKHKSWSHHRLGLVERYRSGSPMLDDDGKVKRGPERIDRYGSTKKLFRAMAHCPTLLSALREALENHGYPVEV